jgi:gluconolactonase
VAGVLDVHDERVLELVAKDAALETVADGFGFTEGPVWVDDGAYLLFSVVTGNRRYRWDEQHGARVVSDPSGFCNGMTLDRAGRLVVCEAAARAIVRMDADGAGAGREILADRYRGRALNSPNDVVVGSDGAVWFTDSWYLDKLLPGSEQELDFEGVFRIPPGGGEVELVLRDTRFPNGLCLSPDETLLYVNETAVGHIRVVGLGGAADAEGRLFAQVPYEESGHVDGMKCDERGNVWVTGPGGIWIIDAAGRHLGTIRTPQRGANLAWGGADRRSLFLTCVTDVHRLETLVAGSR